jgi:hypothetical protein
MQLVSEEPEIKIRYNSQFTALSIRLPGFSKTKMYNVSKENKYKGKTRKNEAHGNRAKY